MLDWIQPNGKNIPLETLVDKHIADFPAPGGNTAAMLIKLLDLEPFYGTHEFVVDLQSGELFCGTTRQLACSRTHLQEKRL